MNIICRGLILGTIAAFLVACATTPFTQRRQLSFIPNTQLAQLSLDTYEELQKDQELVEDPEIVGPIEKVAQDLVDATEKYLKDNNYDISEYDWKFVVIKDDETANAWCLPGGKIAVYTGILPYTKNDDGLAVVLGHEIAHAIAHHGNERMSQQMVVQLGESALSAALKNQPEKTQQIFGSVYGIGSQVGVMLPYSRLHENEADRIGLILTAMAGYDPRESVPFWQRMNEASGQQPLELLSTHPAPQTRIQNLKTQYIPEAMQYYNPEEKA